mmetsp:Transcript_15232/g.37475  ORF Transcript_15232/g.37475 Transcript_15232/m.37475 type:complete len:200 (-) Transcript_15232:691-1290(-)
MRKLLRRRCDRPSRHSKTPRPLRPSPWARWTPRWLCSRPPRRAEPTTAWRGVLSSRRKPTSTRALARRSPRWKRRRRRGRTSRRPPLPRWRSLRTRRLPLRRKLRLPRRLPWRPAMRTRPPWQRCGRRRRQRRRQGRLKPPPRARWKLPPRARWKPRRWPDSSFQNLECQKLTRAPLLAPSLVAWASPRASRKPTSRPH